MMRLAYFCYDKSLARVILYGMNAPDIVISSVSPHDRQQHTESLQAFEQIFVSPPFIRQQGFFLESGESRLCGGFPQGLQITEKTGVFESIPNAFAITEYRTIAVENNRNSIEMPPTDIMLLSNLWHGHHITVDTESGVSKRVTGWSIERGERACECFCALVSILTGKDAGWAGYLLWGGNGGIRLGGSHGRGQPAMFFASSSYFPDRVQKVVEHPPLSAQINNPVSFV